MPPYDETPAVTACPAGPVAPASGVFPRVEERVLRRIAGSAPRYPGLVSAVTAFGSRPAAYTVTLGSAAALARRGQGAAAVRTVATLVSGDLARELLCRWVGRARPPVELRHGSFDGASFPSRHATLAALTAGAVIGASSPAHRRGVAAAAITGCVAVGASRLRLGVHWPSDVAAGFLFAVVWRGVTSRPGRPELP